MRAPSAITFTFLLVQVDDVLGDEEYAEAITNRAVPLEGVVLYF